MSAEGKSRSVMMRLSTIARERSVPFDRILTEFLLERMLARLTLSERLSTLFVFKGGYVGRRAYGSPRYTVDLDAILADGSINSVRNEIILSVEKDLDDTCWFRFESTQDLETQGEYPGTRFIFRSGVGEAPATLDRAQRVSLDIGVGDFLKSLKQHIDPLLSQEAIHWRVYTRELIVAEKLHAFLSRPIGNSRSKDLFDLKFYLPSCQEDKLKEAIQGTFAARKTPLPPNVSEAFSSLRTENLSKGWKSAVIDLGDIGTFEEVLHEVTTLLKKLLP